MRTFGFLSVAASCALACVLLETPGCGGGDHAGSTSSVVGPGGPVIACTSDGQCMRPVPYCSPQAGVCVACLGDPNCSNGRHCDPASHACVQCTDNTQCGGGGEPYCSPTTHECVQCIAPAN